MISLTNLQYILHGQIEVTGKKSVHTWAPKKNLRIHFIFGHPVSCKIVPQYVKSCKIDLMKNFVNALLVFYLPLDLRNDILYIQY